jgi:hypothetical protein
MSKDLSTAILDWVLGFCPEPLLSSIVHVGRARAAVGGSDVLNPIVLIDVIEAGTSATSTSSRIVTVAEALAGIAPFYFLTLTAKCGDGSDPGHLKSRWASACFPSFVRAHYLPPM